jgi:hypothetical protein
MGLSGPWLWRNSGAGVDGSGVVAVVAMPASTGSSSSEPMLAGGDADGGQQPSSTLVFLPLCGGGPVASSSLMSPVFGQLRQHQGLARVKALHVDACGLRFLSGDVFMASTVPPPLEIWNNIEKYRYDILFVYIHKYFYTVITHTLHFLCHFLSQYKCNSSYRKHKVYKYNNVKIWCVQLTILHSGC